MEFSNNGGIYSINSITDILPDYEAALEQQCTKIQPKPYDPYKDAMHPWTPGNGANIKDIKAQWSVARVLGQNGSARRWQTTCPLPDHQDETPSFTVYPNETWYCFGCNRTGDAIDLYAALHQLDLAGAMREMAAQ
jgi:hypothetical protein